MTTCKPGCHCKCCTVSRTKTKAKTKPGSSVMREHPALFKSPVVRASRLGTYTPMMRKDTFLHRMSYNPRPFEDETRDHTALLNTLLHRLDVINPNDARYGYYQGQIQSLQNQINDMKTKHDAMMQGRQNLINYVTENAGNLVPAEAIGPVMTRNYASFTPPPIPSPEVARQPLPSLGVPAGDEGIHTSGAPPPGPIGSIENAAVEAYTEPEAPPEQPVAAPVAKPQEMPTQEEDDKNLYSILSRHKNLSKVERSEMNRILRSYPKDSDVFAGAPEPEHETPSSNESESEGITSEPEEVTQYMARRERMGSPSRTPEFLTSESEIEGEPMREKYKKASSPIQSESEAEEEHGAGGESEAEEETATDSSYVPLSERINAQAREHTLRSKYSSSSESEEKPEAEAEEGETEKQKTLARRKEERRRIAEQRLYAPHEMAREFKKYTPTQLHRFVNDELGIHATPGGKGRVSDAAHQRALRELIEHGGEGKNKTAFIEWMKQNPGGVKSKS